MTNRILTDEEIDRLDSGDPVDDYGKVCRSHRAANAKIREQAEQIEALRAALVSLCETAEQTARTIDASTPEGTIPHEALDANVRYCRECIGSLDKTI